MEQKLGNNNNKERGQEFILTEDELERFPADQQEYMQTSIKNLYQLMSMFVESAISDPAKLEALRECGSLPDIHFGENKQEHLRGLFLPDIQTPGSQERELHGEFLSYLVEEIENLIVEFLQTDHEEEDEEDCYDVEGGEDDEDSVELKN